MRVKFESTHNGACLVSLKWLPVVEGKASRVTKNEPLPRLSQALHGFPKEKPLYSPKSLSTPDAAAFINPHHQKCLVLWEIHLTHTYHCWGLGFLIILLAGPAHLKD